MICGLQLRAQESDLKTLEQALVSTREDTAKIALLRTLSIAARGTNPDLAKDYAFQGLRLALKNKRTKDATVAEIQIATAYIYLGIKDSSLLHFNKAIALARENQLNSELSAAYANLAILHNAYHEDSLTIYWLKTALGIDTLSGDTLRILKGYNNLGISYFQQTDYRPSLEYFFKALELTDQDKDKAIRGKLLTNIGRCYQYLGDLDNAMHFYQQSIEQIDSNDIPTKIHILLNIGEIQSKQGKPEAALLHFREALNLKTPAYMCTLNWIMCEMGNAFLALNEYDSVLVYGDRIIQSSVSCIDQESSEAYASYLLGTANTRKGKLKLGEKQLRSGLAAWPTPDLDLDLLKLYRALGENLKKQKRFEESIVFLEKYSHYKDSANEALIANTREMLQVEMQHHLTMEKRLLQSKQKNEQLLMESKISKAKNIRDLSIAGFIGFLIIAYALFHSNRRKKQANRILQEKNTTILEQQQELQVQSDLLQQNNLRIQELSDFKERLTHMAVHDMKNPLHTILGLSTGDFSKTKMEIIHRTGGQMLHFLVNMLDIYKLEQANISLNLETHSIQALIEEAKAQVKLLLKDKSIRVVDQSKENIKGVLDGAIFIRIAVNLLTNAIKYSRIGGTIYLVVKRAEPTEEERTFEFTVTDEGQGIDQNQLAKIFEELSQKAPQHITKSVSTGIGLNFCKLAVQAHGGSIIAKSTPEKGTSITIKLPLKNASPNTEENPTPLSDESNSPQLILPEELDIIKTYALRLSAYKVYEVGLISPLLRDLDDLELQSIWKDQIKAAVYSGNQELYTKLINTILPHEKF